MQDRLAPSWNTVAPASRPAPMASGTVRQSARGLMTATSGSPGQCGPALVSGGRAHVGRKMVSARVLRSRRPDSGLWPGHQRSILGARSRKGSRMIHDVASQLPLLVGDSAAADGKTISAERRIFVPAPPTTARPSALCRVSDVHLMACPMYFCRASSLRMDRASMP